MVSRLTGGTVRPGPGYNTGTLKSTLSGFTAGSQQDTDDANILSDASTSQNSDDIPLPQPKKLTPQKITPKPVSPPPATPVTPAVEKNNSPFANIKKPPALPSKAPVSEAPKPAKPVSVAKVTPPTKPAPKAVENETDADCLSDASKSDLSLSELGDTTEQESDWPEMNQPVSSIKPRSITPKAITPVTPTITNAVKPTSPAMSKASSRVQSVKQSDAEIVTDYDDLSDTDLTLGDTTDAETTNNNTTVKPNDITRHESMRSEMTESDWDFEAPTIKPTVASIKPQSLTPTKLAPTGQHILKVLNKKISFKSIKKNNIF